MKTKFSNQTEDYKSCYMKEYSFFNGDYDVILASKRLMITIMGESINNYW